MRADPLRHVQAGEKLEIRADTWNALVDAARWVRDHTSQRGGGVIADPITPSCMVLVRNDTGSNLTSRSVVRVDDWVVTPVDHPFEVMQRPALKGNTPNATTNAIAILYDAIPANQFGRAIIQGIAAVDVLVNDSSHTYARPYSGTNSKLESATSGPARIIKWETSGSTRRAIVCLDTIALGGGAAVYGRANSSPALPGYGPRPTINLIEASPTVGQNIDIAIADDSTDNELEFTIDNLGLFGRAQDGSEGTGGPRRRLNLSKTAQSMGTNFTVVLTDDAASDELDYVFEALGMFARKGTGSTVGPQPRFSFIEGSGITFTVAEDAGSDEIDVTVTVATGGISTTMLADDSVTFAKIQNISTDTILGRDTAGSGDVESLTVGAGLEISGGALQVSSTPVAAGPPVWVKVTKTYSDFATASTSNTITVYSLPIRGMVHQCVIKHTTAFSGGAISAYTIDVKQASISYTGPFNVFQAVGDTTFAQGGSIDTIYNFGSTTAISAEATSTGDNLDQASAGAVAIWLLVSIVQAP